MILKEITKTCGIYQIFKNKNYVNNNILKNILSIEKKRKRFLWRVNNIEQ